MKTYKIDNDFILNEYEINAVLRAYAKMKGISIPKKTKDKKAILSKYIGYFDDKGELAYWLYEDSPEVKNSFLPIDWDRLGSELVSNGSYDFYNGYTFKGNNY